MRGMRPATVTTAPYLSAVHHTRAANFCQKTVSSGQRISVRIGVDKEPQVSNLFVSPLGADRPCDTDLFVCPKNTEELLKYAN